MTFGSEIQGFSVRPHSLTSRKGMALLVTKKIIVITSILAALAQLFLDHGHYIYIVASLLGTFLLFYSLRNNTLQTTPISSMMLIGYGLAWFYLPLIATTIEGKSLINNLARPDLVFLHNLILNVSLILAHIIYLRVYLLRRLSCMLSNRFLRPLGLFTPPSSSQLWLIGIIGLICSWFTAQDNYIDSQKVGVVLKFLEGFQLYMYAPYMIFVSPLFGEKSRVSRRNLVYLVCFTALVIMLGLAHNCRTLIIWGFVNLAISYLLGVWLNRLKIPKLNLIKIVASLIIAGLTIFFLTNIAKAIVIARADRDKVAVNELILSTIEIVSDPVALGAYDKMAAEGEQSDGWDERYVNNLFLSRFCNLKFADNTLLMVDSFTQPQKTQLIENEIQTTFCFLPAPILNLLPIHIDKDFVTSGCAGDVIYNIHGAADAIGGKRTGSLIAVLLGIFGWTYPFWMIITSIILYIIVDSYVMMGSTLLHIDGSYPLANKFSLVILLFICNTTFLLTSSGGGIDSYSNIIGFIVRGYLQTVLLYSFIYLCVRFITRVKV